MYTDKQAREESAAVSPEYKPSAGITAYLERMAALKIAAAAERERNATARAINGGFRAPIGKLDGRQ